MSSNSETTEGPTEEVENIYYRFPDQESALEWNGMIRGMNERADSIAANSRTGKWENKEIAANIYGFFSMFNDLERKFGAVMVPPDAVYLAREYNKFLADMRCCTYQIGNAESRPAPSGCQVIKTEQSSWTTEEDKSS